MEAKEKLVRVPESAVKELEGRRKEDRANQKLTAASTGLAAGTLALLKGMKQPGTPEAMEAHVLEMAAKMGLEPGTLSVQSPDKWYDINRAWSPHYDPVNKAVNIPTKLRDAAIAHELGHAKNDVIVSSLAGGKLKIPYHAIELASRIGSGVSLGYNLSEAARQSKDELSYKPGLIHALISSPMIAEEIAASARATSHLVREHGALKGAAKALPLVPAFGTYAAMASAPLLVTYFRKKALEREMAERAKVDETKTAAVSVKPEVFNAFLNGRARNAGKKPSDFDQAAIRKGAKVEREHSANYAVQKRIAADHLQEDPRYYDKLEKMESGYYDQLEKKAELPKVEEALKHQKPTVGDFQKTLKPGDVLLTAPDRKKLGGFWRHVYKPISTKVQGTDYGHAAIYAGDGKVLEARLGAKTRAVPLAKLLKRNNAVAFRPAVPASERKQAVEFAQKQTGTSFDLKSIARAATPFRGHRSRGARPEEAKSYICSGLVANAYAKRRFSSASRAVTRPSEIAQHKVMKPLAALAKFNKEE